MNIGSRSWITAATYTLTLLGLIGSAHIATASEAVTKVERDYVMAPPAPANQPSASAVSEKSAGCVSCHTDSDQKTMHNAPVSYTHLTLPTNREV